MGRHLTLLIVAVMAVNSAFSQCSNFSIVANKSSTCAPDIVRYQVVNPVSGSSYEWNVGQGSVSGVDTLFAFYNSAATITASVKITLPNNMVCTVTENDIVTIRDIPDPKFTASKVIMCNGPEYVEFKDITPNSASRNWIIDGTNYNHTADSVGHQFVTSGYKKVSLVVVDSFGCEGVAQFADTIKIYPDLDFNFRASSKSGCAPQTIDFVINKDVNTPFTERYKWSFPGSNQVNASGKNPGSRTYNSEGTYDVTLTISLDNGCSYDLTKPSFVKIGKQYPLDLNILNAIACGDGPVTLALKNDSLPGNINWSISGLTGSIDTVDKYKRLFYTQDSGDLSITVTHEQHNCLSERTFNSLVYRKNVLAQFSSEDNYHCDTPHTVHLWNESDTMDATSLSYTWNIYDGANLIHTSSGLHDSMTFTTLPGLYSVELIAQGDNGCSDTMFSENFIYQDTMDLDFTPQPSIGCVGQEIYFANNTKPTSYLSPDEFIWTFYALDDSTVLDTSHEVSPTMIYYDTGYYDVMVTGMNGIGCHDTLEVPMAVRIIETDLKYRVMNPNICSGDSFQLFGLSEPLDAQIDHEWTFIHQQSGNTYTFTGDTVNAEIAEIGNYDLVVTSNILGGCETSDTTEVSVNGVEAILSLDTLVVCNPYDLAPELEIVNNTHFPLNDASLSYQWSISPSATEIISGQNTIDPTIRLVDEGIFNVNVLVTNSFGCQLELWSDTLQSGANADFKVIDKALCIGDSVRVRQNSYDPAISYTYWISEDPTLPFIASDSANQAVLIPDTGLYTLFGEATVNGNCSDTASFPISIVQVIADFSSNDTFLQCAPVYVQFQSHSINADSLFWDFGDGTNNTTTSASAGTIYEKNTGPTDGYDIRLIAKNNEGCLDTSVKEDYIIVQGPQPYFRLDNNIGCEPLEVDFIDSSFDVARYYINYNDGSDLDSTSFGSHTYVNKTNKLVQRIWPSIFVYDSLGCGAIYESEEPVVIYKKPNAGFTMDYDIDQCIPYRVSLSDTGEFAINSNWYVNDEFYSDLQDEEALLYEPGYNTVTLITTNKHYCSDTAEKEVFVSGIPKLEMEILDTLCLRKNITFKPVVITSEFTDTSNMRLYWDFGESEQIGNQVQNNGTTSYVFTTGGNKRIKLQLVLANGCTDSLITWIYVRDESDLEIPQIHYVSFIDNYLLEISHETSKDHRFEEYILNSSIGGEWRSSDLLDTLYTYDLIQQPQNICYEVRIKDFCDLTSLPSMAHCFIDLNVQSTQPFENELSWSHYVGWDQIKSYKVFRRVEGDVNFQLIAEVPGNQNWYTDKDLCDLEYSYYVQASNTSNNFTSNSYRVSQRPLYAPNPFSSSIKNVTVTEGDELLITWNSSPHNRWNNFILSKYRADLNEIVESFELKDTFYYDRDVSTSEYSYIYYLKERDICGELNSSDREGKSILLNGYYNKASYLSWSAYQQWLNGVEQYDIEFFDATGLKSLATVDGATLQYRDDLYHPYVFGPYCYRVFATNDIKDTSYSNVICLEGDPTAFIPNAFSPNDDGHNESFRPITNFVLNGEVLGVNSYKLEIFSRWGQKVFESTDLREAWDGTFEGSDCQQDVYIYHMNCVGIDGTIFSYKGTISLLR